MKKFLIAVAAILVMASPAMADVIQDMQNQIDNLNAQLQLQKQQQGQSTSVNIGGASGGAIPNLIQLPGVMGAYQNFTQPYKPEVFINGAGPIRPTRMTMDQADKCGSGLGFWGVNSDYVGASSSTSQSIALYYPAWDKVLPTGDISAYVGTSSVSAKDKPWLTTLCAAAKKAMENGASVGVVEYIIRPVNKSAGLMLGASFGGSGMAGAALNPYALAGTLGGGFGVSNAYVQGELMLQVTGMTTAPKSARIGGDELKPAALESTDDADTVSAQRHKAIIRNTGGQ